MVRKTRHCCNAVIKIVSRYLENMLHAVVCGFRNYVLEWGYQWIFVNMWVCQKFRSHMINKKSRVIGSDSLTIWLALINAENLLHRHHHVRGQSQ